ncbi:heme ABC transporter substrate-binding protein IsdE [Sporosarcina sp. NCCP-2222]|uniref:ABC transporter substrate-binding protein n=1 Tax=Sporosarcina sp. NCCP-2222 TaxID=2935073 RepID=UPI00208C51FE|nr:ABC transporter substrate-binding protein [Sporosarcina sp. NCCP-2222]GKV56501.1 heme ABC transporter substrate-binding protein IsdE [Sporosarcina sp. NCCP-2222]
MKKVFGVLLVGASLALTACTSDKEEPEKADQVSAQAEDEQQETSNENTYGVDEKKLDELMTQFPETEADRIITTSVPLAEMLNLLDITPVGVPTSTNPLPKEFESIDQIGSPMAPDLEVITSLQPDLLLGAKSLQSSLDESLKGMNLQTAYLPTDSFDDLKTSFSALGTYFNKEQEMNAVLDKLQKKEEELKEKGAGKELKEKGAGKELPSVMLMIGTADSFMVMNEKSYIGSLIDKLGAENIATTILQAKDTYSALNLEDVVAADPDLILVLASGDHGASEDMFKKEVEKNETWKRLSAYQNDNIHILDYEVFGVTSIQNAERALTDIATYFYE